MAEDCTTRLLDPEIQKKLFGERKVPSSVIKQLVEDLEAIRAGVDTDPKFGTYQSRVKKYIKERRELGHLEKMVRTTNLRLTKDRMAFYGQKAFEKDPAEGLKAMLTFSKFLANSGRDSLEARMTALQSSYRNFLLAGLEERGLKEVFQSGKIDEDVHIAVEALALGKKPEGVSFEATRVAEVVHQLNRKFFRDMRDAGVPVRFMEGYIGAQTHNIDAIKELGFEKWYTITLPLLDFEKTFGVHANDAGKIKKAMQHMYKAIVAGRVGDDSKIGGESIEDMIKNTGFTRSLSQKLSESRFLRFKDGKRAHEYNSQLGRGNMFENVIFDISRKGKMIAAVQKFGSNPEASIRADMDRLESKFRTAGDMDKVRAIQVARGDIENMFKEVMGETSIPGQNTLAKVGRNIRVINTLSKLAYAGVRSISNFATAAVELKTNTGQNLLESTWNVTKNFLNGIPEKDRVYFARKMGYFIQDMQSEMLNAGLATGATSNGLGARSMRAMFKLNGLNLMTDGMRIAYGNGIMEEMADNSSKSFDQLNSRLKASLLAGGIDAIDFEVLSRSIETMPDGRKMVTVDGIPKVDPDYVKRAALFKKMSVSKYLRELELKYAGWIISGTNVASTTAGSRERNIINGGTYTGTWQGETRRLIGQFKTFAIQAHFIANRILNSAPDEQRLLRGELMSRGMDSDTAMGRLKKKDFASFAQFLVASTALGFVGEALIDTANGKGVSDPASPDTWVEAMTKGGAGGLYTDFMAGEYDRFSFTENLLGPTLGQIGPLAKTVSLGRKALLAEDGEGLEDRVIKETTRLVRNNIPFQQVPLAKQALDYLQYDVIQESLTPGYKARSELLKLRKEQGLQGE